MEGEVVRSTHPQGCEAEQTHGSFCTVSGLDWLLFELVVVGVCEMSSHQLLRDASLKSASGVYFQTVFPNCL